MCLAKLSMSFILKIYFKYTAPTYTQTAKIQRANISIHRTTQMYCSDRQEAGHDDRSILLLIICINRSFEYAHESNIRNKQEWHNSKCTFCLPHSFTLCDVLFLKLHYRLCPDCKQNLKKQH